MKYKLIGLAILIIINSCRLNSQTAELDCLKKFNSSIKIELINLSDNKLCVSSDNIKLVFEIFINNKEGKIDSVFIRNSNLSKFHLNEDQLKSKILEQKFPCLREIYYEGAKFPPDRIIIMYNTSSLENVYKLEKKP